MIILKCQTFDSFKVFLSQSCCISYYLFFKINCGHGLVINARCSSDLNFLLFLAFCKSSIRLCEVGSGVQHMLLCRVIMGNAEQVRPGSKQYCPRKKYDMGVDNVLNPKCYIVWSTHLDKYIYPEYMVRFALPSRNKGTVMQLDS